MEHLTKKQKEVWSKEETYWDCWKSGDVERFMALWHPDVVAWPRECYQPVTKSSIREVMEAIFKNITPGAVSTEARIQSITFYGNNNDEIAIVHYEGDIFWKDPQKGIDRHDQGRLLHVWAKHEGEWKIITGMSAEVTTQGVQRWSST